MTHKNKTLSALLALLFGAVGIHRFYLHGKKDIWGWLHAATLPLSLSLLPLTNENYTFFALLPLVISGLIGILSSLVIGLTADEKWDARFNPSSGRRSDSQWPLALMMVLAFSFGAFGTIATMARCFDLLYTGGAHG